MQLSEKLSSETPNTPLDKGSFFRDIRAKKSYIILDERKIIVDMPNDKPSTVTGRNIQDKKEQKQEQKKVDVLMTNKRSGGVIAGFKTVKYDLVVEGKKCFEISFSKDKSLSTMISGDDEESTNDDESLDICDQASNSEPEEMHEKYGYAVKITDAQGEIVMLLKEIKVNAMAPSKYLAFPSGYKLMSMMEMMGQIMTEKLSK